MNTARGAAAKQSARKPPPSKSTTAGKRGASAKRDASAKRGASAKRSASAKGTTSNKRTGSAKRTASQGWELRLYIAGQTPNSIAAVSNLRKICDDQLRGRYRIEIIDLLKRPQLAQADQIVAIPTLVRKLPPPIKRIIGDLSRAERALVGLDVKPAR